jgi:oxygen-independent coproporphyrinogen-3 oxidase
MASLPLGAPLPESGVLDFRTDAVTPFSVYVHIPFCTVRCGYCDFNTYTSTELRGVTRESFVDDVVAEIDFSASVLATSDVPIRSAHSVFFGGGTPSLLHTDQIARVIESLRGVHGIDADAEVTIEANPDTVTPQILEQLSDAGITRVSFGMQSAVPRVLDLLDRTHDPDRLPEVVRAAREVGLSTSVDLIYGTPTETIDEWHRSLESAIELNTDHISAYSLIVEDGTAMARRIARGELPPVDDDVHAEMYELCDSTLSSAGYQWYEVSNWSKPGFESLHNQAYWNSTDWWGYGPGAHSHVGGARWWNAKHPAAYAERLSRGSTPGIGHEILSEPERLFERIVLQIRVRSGLRIADIPQVSPGVIPSLIARGLVDGVAALAGRLVLTLHGRLLADSVARDLTS